MPEPDDDTLGGHGLGRLPAPDDRDNGYPVARLLAAAPVLPAYRYWHPGAWSGDQGRTSMCVAYSWTHWLKAGPDTQRAHVPDPAPLYAEAQRVDEWPGEEPAYQGTSVRAGAKVLQARGYVGSYWWATTADEVAAAVLGVGPVVVGTDWHAGMNRPVRGDGWRMHATGPVLGGHAYLLDGYSTKTRLFRCKNSWGRGYGNRGFAWLPADTLDLLLARHGEACLAVETTPGR